jgi:hypothetical protein
MLFPGPLSMRAERLRLCGNLAGDNRNSALNNYDRVEFVLFQAHVDSAKLRASTSCMIADFFSIFSTCSGVRVVLGLLSISVISRSFLFSALSFLDGSASAFAPDSALAIDPLVALSLTIIFEVFSVTVSTSDGFTACVWRGPCSGCAFAFAVLGFSVGGGKPGMPFLTDFDALVSNALTSSGG